MSISCEFEKVIAIIEVVRLRHIVLSQFCKNFVFRLVYGEKLVNHGAHVSVQIQTEISTSSGCVRILRLMKIAKHNWIYLLTAGGASNNPCSDTYGGPSPFSEPETAAIRNFYGTIASRTRIFLSFHAFGQYLLMPYGHTTAQSTNHANLLSVANAGANAIRATAGADYLVGSTASVLCQYFRAAGNDLSFANNVIQNKQFRHSIWFESRLGIRCS